MADETDLSETFESSDDTAYDDFGNETSHARPFIVAFGEVLICAVAGFLLGWGISIVLERWSER